MSWKGEILVVELDELDELDGLMNWWIWLLIYCLFDWGMDGIWQQNVDEWKNGGKVEVALGSICSKILKSRVVVVVAEDDEWYLGWKLMKEWDACMCLWQKADLCDGIWYLIDNSMFFEIGFWK